jgi:hypothetical protein
VVFDLWIVVGPTVGEAVVVVVVGVVVVPPPPPPGVVVVVVVGVVVVVVGVVVVVVGVVVVVVGVVVVVVVVVVVTPSQCESVRTGVGAGPVPFHVHVANAVVFAAVVLGPGTSATKLFPTLVMVKVFPFTLSTTLVTSSASFPNPARIQCVVPPPHGRFWDPFPVHGVFSELANAAVGRMTHIIISRVAAVTAMRPAAVSRLLLFVLRSAGIFPTSIVLTVSATGGHLCPALAILGPRYGLLHPPKVPDCRKPLVLTLGSHPKVAQSVRAAALEGNRQLRPSG